jgi:hypothetical protein
VSPIKSEIRIKRSRYIKFKNLVYLKILSSRAQYLSKGKSIMKCSAKFNLNILNYKDAPNSNQNTSFKLNNFEERFSFKFNCKINRISNQNLKYRSPIAITSLFLSRKDLNKSMHSYNGNISPIKYLKGYYALICNSEKCDRLNNFKIYCRKRANKFFSLTAKELNYDMKLLKICIESKKLIGSQIEESFLEEIYSVNCGHYCDSKIKSDSICRLMNAIKYHKLKVLYKNINQKCYSDKFITKLSRDTSVPAFNNRLSYLKRDFKERIYTKDYVDKIQNERDSNKILANDIISKKVCDLSYDSKLVSLRSKLFEKVFDFLSENDIAKKLEEKYVREVAQDININKFSYDVRLYEQFAQKILLDVLQLKELIFSYVRERILDKQIKNLKYVIANNYTCLSNVKLLKSRIETIPEKMGSELIILKCDEYIFAKENKLYINEQIFTNEINNILNTIMESEENFGVYTEFKRNKLVDGFPLVKLKYCLYFDTNVFERKYFFIDNSQQALEQLELSFKAGYGGESLLEILNDYYLRKTLGKSEEIPLKTLLINY